MARRRQPVSGRPLTDAAVPGVVAAAALEVSHAAVPGEGVHDAGRADGVYEGCFPGSWGRGGGKKKLSHANIDIGLGLLGMKVSCAARVKEEKEQNQTGLCKR